MTEDNTAAAATPAAAGAAAAAPKKHGTKDDIKTTRDRWWGRPNFILATVGCSIGLGNIWKFPYLTFKHGGLTFILAYLWALFIVGIPMLLLELTLGQKMQKGSAGALRGIVPRLAGIGWVAAFAGFITCLVYNVLLGMVLYYMVMSGGEPWTEEKLARPLGCTTAALMGVPPSEIFLHMNVTKLYGEDTCAVYRDGDTTRFSSGLFIGAAVSWFLCFLSLVKGTASIQVITVVTNVVKFILLFVLMAQFLALNSSKAGQGIDYYLRAAPFPLPADADGLVKFKAAGGSNSKDLFQDAYAQVFFSVGVCVGTMFAYGSYNKTKKPVIMDSIAICLLDFVFALLAGFIVWGAVGYLQASGNIAYNQTSNVGLTFIAMPVAASVSESPGMFTTFCVMMFFAGIDSAFGFVEGLVTNVIDQTNLKRWQAAALVCIAGVLLSCLFTTNWGWVLFDLVEHYISSYIITAVGLCQCISVGWLFERKATADRSPEHARSMRTLALMYWFPVIILNFYANFGFPEVKNFGIVIIFVTTLIAFACSWCQSKMTFNSWYHEILQCGTDKISMSITILSNANGERSFWMLPFEAYFGILIKFVNPCCLIFLLFEALANDLKDPYGITQGTMPMFATMYVMLAVLIIFVPMMMCDQPETFTHNVEKEFSADDIYEKAQRAKKRKAGAAGGKETEMTANQSNTSQQPLKPDDGLKIEDAEAA